MNERIDSYAQDKGKEVKTMPKDSVAVLLDKYKSKLNTIQEKESFKQTLEDIKSVFGDEFIKVIGSANKLIPIKDIEDLAIEARTVKTQKELEQVDAMLDMHIEFSNFLRQLDKKSIGQYKDNPTVLIQRAKQFIESKKSKNGQVSLDNVSTERMIKGTDYEKGLITILGSEGEANNFVSRLQYESANILRQKGLGEVLDPKVINNMSVGFTNMIIKGLFQGDNNSNFAISKMAESMKNGTLREFLTKHILTVKDYGQKFDKICDVIKGLARKGQILDKGIQNPAIYDPSIFEQICSNYFNGRNLSDNDLEMALLQNKGELAGGLKNKDVFAGKIMGVRSLSQELNEMKKLGKEGIMQNGDLIMELKSVFDSLNIKGLSDIFGTILKLCGFKNGFDDFQKAYLENNVGIDDYQKNLLGKLLSNYKDLQVPNIASNPDFVKFLSDSGLSLNNSLQNALKDFNLVGFKNSFKKGIEDEQNVRLGDYVLPINLLKEYSKQHNISGLFIDGKIVKEKLAGLDGNKILDSHLKSTIQLVTNNASLQENMKTGQDLAYISFAKAINSQITDKNISYILNYKNNIVQAKPAEAKPAEAKPAEAKPAEAKPAEAKPAEAKPAEAKPTEAKPTEAKPAEAKPTEAKPTEAKPAEAKPAEAKPTEVKPAEVKPVGSDNPVDGQVSI